MDKHTLAKQGAGVVLIKLLETENPKIVRLITRTMHEFKEFLNEIDIITNVRIKKQLGMMVFIRHKEILIKRTTLNPATQTHALCHLQGIWRNWIKKLP